MKFDLEDLEYRVWKSHDYGGQHVGVDASVIVIHKPTGIAVIRSSERSQMKNKLAAVEQLRAIITLTGPTNCG